MGFKSLIFSILLTCNLLSAERFYNVDETLLIDSQLKIEWLMQFKETHSFTEAKQYCQSTQIDNKKNFRLPSMSELISLVKYTMLHDNGFSFSGEFWSSSLDETNEKNIFIFSVELPSGTFVTHDFNATLNTVCVYDINDSI